MNRAWVIALFCAACSVTPEAQTITLTQSDLPATAGLVGDRWQSSDFYDGATSADWIEFPGRATVIIPHTLGRTPVLVDIYLSFNETGESAAPSAGDLSRVTEVTEDHITLRNATDEDFYVRVALE